MEHVFQLTLNLFALAVHLLDGLASVVKFPFATLHALQDDVYFQMFVIVLELDLQVQLVMFTHAKHLALIMDTVLDQTNVTALILEDISVLIVKFQSVTKVLMEDASTVEFAKLHNIAIAQALDGWENGVISQFVTETSVKMEEYVLVLTSVIASKLGTSETIALLT